MVNGRHLELLGAKPKKRTIRMINDSFISKKHKGIAPEPNIEHCFSINNIVADEYKFIQRKLENPGLVDGLSTGFKEIDVFCNGLTRNCLVVIAARPGMGKCCLVRNIAINVAISQNKTVAYFSLNMSRSLLVKRLIASESGMDFWKMISNRLSGDDLSKWVEAARTLSESRMVIYDHPTLTPDQLAAAAQILHIEHDLGLIIIDSLEELLPNDPRNKSRAIQIQEISMALKSLSHELGIPIIVTSELDQMLENRKDKWPHISDFSPENCIYQYADVVMLLYRDALYRKDTPRGDRLTDIIFSKNRNGPGGSTQLSYRPERSRFETTT